MSVKVSEGVLLILSIMLLGTVVSMQNQMCEMMREIDREREACEAQIENRTTGCSRTWDKITCWPSADTGEVVTISCPKYLFYFSGDAFSRNLSKTCTEDGWIPFSVDSYIIDCGYNPNSTVDDNTGEFFFAIKVGYTIGHSVSLISLTVAIITLCLSRKLHCTRNYIHIHLFVSLILKAVAVFIKDVVLYDVGETENCQASVGCKAVVVFFQYGIMASYFWLLVEGLYLHTLLAVSFFSERKYFWWYILIGWGAPTIFISTWVITKALLSDFGCWETIDDSSWWIIKSPILVTILVNFFLFIFIIRILLQKMNCPDIGRKESNQYLRAFFPKMVKFSSPYKTRSREEAALNDSADGNDCGALDEQNYVHALGTEDDEDGVSRVTGSSIFTFKQNKRSHSMAQTASDLAKTPGKSVTFSKTSYVQPSTPTRTGCDQRCQSRTPRMNKKVQFVSTTPHRLGKRMTIPSLHSDSDSQLSPSDSEEEKAGDEEESEQKVKKEDKENLKTQGKGLSAALYKTPAKKRKSSTSEPVSQPTMVEEYFEAHGSSKVLTSDRTLERLHTPKLDRETLVQLLEGKPSSYADEIQQLHDKHKKYFSKWMLQLKLGFNVLVYGLGSKKALLDDFRVSYLAQDVHLVVNGFFPSITLKSILNALTFEVLEYQGTFRTPSDQIQFITKTLEDQPDLHVYLLIHNIDGPMLRGEKTQSALGQLASLHNLHLVASLDHINAPLVWDQFKQSQFNWLWWECVTFQHYVEETSYENSLLVQQTGTLALSSLTHVLRSLTSNARGIFKVLVKFQLENKDSPSYTGMSFQDFYQRCREAFLVNSDLTLRTQLTEFRDHKLIRTRKGADGVEFLIVAVDTGTLMDFLENEEVN